MELIILLIVGGIVGWLASLIMRTDAQQGILLNIVVGIVGSVLAGLILTPLLGAPPITSGSITMTSIIVSLLGAIILLAAVNLVRRGSVRGGVSRPLEATQAALRALRCCGWTFSATMNLALNSSNGTGRPI